MKLIRSTTKGAKKLAARIAGTHGPRPISGAGGATSKVTSLRTAKIPGAGGSRFAFYARKFR